MSSYMSLIPSFFLNKQFAGSLNYTEDRVVNKSIVFCKTLKNYLHEINYLKNYLHKITKIKIAKILVDLSGSVW